MQTISEMHHTDALEFYSKKQTDIYRDKSIGVLICNLRHFAGLFEPQTINLYTNEVVTHCGIQLDACFITLNSCQCIFFTDISLVYSDCFCTLYYFFCLFCNWTEILTAWQVILLSHWFLAYGVWGGEYDSEYKWSIWQSILFKLSEMCKLGKP